MINYLLTNYKLLGVDIMDCPRCDVELVTKEINGVNVDYCTKGLGVFLHQGELKKITHPTAGDVEFSSLEHFDLSRVSDVKCPICKNSSMIEVNFVEYSDIVINYCPECSGIWLDKGALELINKEIDNMNASKEGWRHSIACFFAKCPF